VLVGLDAPDDAAVYAWDDDRALVSTVDFFTPIVDDPYTFGAIGAANALSDVYAMGGVPLFALNVVAFPAAVLDTSILADILRGGSDKAAEAGVAIIGGHSIDDKEPKYGLVVIGTAPPDGIYRKSDGRPGDRLVLTKAIGTGVIATAIKAEAAPPEVEATAVASMVMLNARALELARQYDVGAMTDVTGFGLTGHLHDLARMSGLAAVIESATVPQLPGAGELVDDGHVPGGTRRNREFVGPLVRWAADIEESQRLLLCDAQTSGGLLVSVAAADSAALVEALRSEGHAAAEIGELIEGAAGVIEVI
jgi:selenide,water dikinase